MWPIVLASTRRSCNAQIRATKRHFFGIYVSEISLFLCSSLMRFFVVQIFSFLRTMCGLLSHLDLFIVVSFVKPTV